jgi:hypothetical protein
VDVSPAVLWLADRYRAGRAGRSAAAVLDCIVSLRELLQKSGCALGPARTEAERDLRRLHALGAVELECAKRHPEVIYKVRVTREKEAEFFRHLGQPAPLGEREQLAALFENAAAAAVPAGAAERWPAFCRECADLARSGASLQPMFDRTDPVQIARMLDLLPKLLAWQGESFRRFASALLLGDSKQLEVWQPRLEAVLARLGLEVRTLADLGMIENPRSLLVHGPLRLVLPGGALDATPLRSPIRLGAADLRAARLTTQATRCVTVENASMLYELAKLQSGVLLASSGSEGGFAHRAIVDFLRALPPEIELHHFGDSDPKGFDILRHLRERTGRAIRSLHMRYRPGAEITALSGDDRKTIRRLLESPHLTGDEKAALVRMADDESKGAYEQESLGVPRAEWPFYAG